jgi:hypothetical protein
MLRRASIIIILLTAIFFAAGWWPVKKGWITEQTYLTAAGIVGGLASVVGLLGLVRSPLTRRDFENVEWEAVTKIADSEKQLLELEGRKAKAHSELDQLTRTRQELSDLVKKASAVLFLQEELDRSSQNLSKFLGKHPGLRKELEEYSENVSRLKALNEEVQHHPDAELIAEVLWRSRNRAVVRRSELIETFNQIPLFGPFLKALFFILDAYVRALRIVIRR